MVESLFKACGRALREAAAKDEKVRGVLSTKGRL
jgi:imidazoleglycerol-phosphate dehydratase